MSLCTERATMDQRDATRRPPAMLDPIWVLRMRLLLLDAKENGDKPWPYGAKRIQMELQGAA